MRKVALVVTGLVVGVPVAAFAANANNPYSNVDHRNDAGNNTGDAQVEPLNQAQLNGTGLTPAPFRLPSPPQANATPFTASRPPSAYANAAPPPGAYALAAPYPYAAYPAPVYGATYPYYAPAYAPYPPFYGYYRPFAFFPFY